MRLSLTHGSSVTRQAFIDVHIDLKGTRFKCTRRILPLFWQHVPAAYFFHPPQSKQDFISDLLFSSSNACDDFMPSFRSRPEFEQFGYQFQNILKLQKALTSRKDGSLNKWFFSNTQFLSGK